VFADNVATKPQLQGHYSPRFPGFRTTYPDQFRMDIFLLDFQRWVEARQKGSGQQMPEFVLVRLPNDHTAGTEAHVPRPIASVADNDLALGRLVEAVSHSPYWDDTAIFAVEDDAQDGGDHVDAHRTVALVISKYSPSSEAKPLVDSSFYTTVSLIRTMEVLLGLPPMNQNDAYAPVMAPLFTGSGDQRPFQADTRNRDNGLIYQANAPDAPGSRESAAMDFTHPDSVNTRLLNQILWHDRWGPDSTPPEPVHSPAVHARPFIQELP
jgi:hypothetical protein